MEPAPRSGHGRAAPQVTPLPVSGQGEGHSPIALLLGQEAGGRYDDLVGVGANSVVSLRPAHDDPIALPLHNPEVEVRVDLLMGSLPSVPLDIGLGAVGGEVVLLEIGQELEKPLVILRPQGLIHSIGNHGEGVHGVDSHTALDAAAGLLAGKAGHLLLVQQVINALMDVTEAIYLLAREVGSGCHYAI